MFCEDHITALMAVWDTWCAAEGLPPLTTMEILHRDDLTDEQRAFATAFVQVWEGVIRHA